MSVEVVVQGETLFLRPDRTLHWPRRETLLIADPHFGKAEGFRAFGLPVPGGDAASLCRLSSAIDATQAARLVVLGDFWHSRAGRSGEVLAELTEWRRRRSDLQIDLIPGNHDRAGRPPEGWGGWQAGELFDPPFAMVHSPATVGEAYALAGHLHPAVVLGRRNRQRLRLPCFWFGPRVGVLPAFGEFTGAANISPAPGDRIFAIADDSVVEVPV